MKALVINGRVTQLSDTPFPVHPSMKWLDVPQGFDMSEQGEEWVTITDEAVTVDEEKKQQVLAERQQALEAKAWIEGRLAEYPSTDELIVALWEKLVEERPEAAEALQLEREAVKQKYPKPEED